MEATLAAQTTRSRSARYAIAIAAPVMGLLLRLPLAPIFGNKLPYITFFFATAASATFGGILPGLLSTALGALFAAVFLVPHTAMLRFVDPGDYAGLALFILIGTFVCYQAGRLLQANQQESALRLLLHQTLHSIGEAVISTDDSNRVRLMNPVAEQLTGWTESDARGKPLKEVLPIVHEGSNAPAQLWETSGRTELVRHDGSRIAVDHTWAPVSGPAGRVAGAVIVLRDITEQRRAEQQLVAAERRSRIILESITDAFMLFDKEWRYRQINPAAEKMLGVSASALLGKVHWEEYPLLRGTILETMLRKALNENVTVHFEHYYAPWGRWFETSAYPSDEGLSVYSREITDRKRSEAALQRLNEDLKHFTFAATHDLREPLRMITVYVQLLEKKYSDRLDEQAHTFIGHVVKGAQRISRLVDGLLQFTRIGDIASTEPVPISATKALAEAMETLQIAIAEARADVQADPMPVVLCQPAHLSQLFQNLIGNALKYRTPGVAPHIRISAVRYATHHVFGVSDNGIGIAPEDQVHIFVPFKRLHGQEIAGAGIGLATCKRIVERYGGRIWVESQAGAGATFYFSLPTAE